MADGFSQPPSPLGVLGGGGQHQRFPEGNKTAPVPLNKSVYKFPDLCSALPQPTTCTSAGNDGDPSTINREAATPSGAMYAEAPRALGTTVTVAPRLSNRWPLAEAHEALTPRGVAETSRVFQGRLYEG